MAKPDISLLGAVYPEVSGIALPKSGGGTATFPWVEGSQTVTENDTYNVTNLAELVVNVSGGGGPTETDAVLLVNAPSGSTITATKGGTTLTPTLWTAASDSSQETALFIITPEQFDATTPWTVTATNGVDTESDTVTIDSNLRYSLTFAYNQYLYKLGDECVANSGGWTLYKASGGSGSKESDHLYLGYSAANNRMARFYTDNLIYFAGYSYLVADMIATSGTNLYVGYATSRTSSTSADFVASARVTAAGSRQLVRVPISTAISRGYYVEIAANAGAVGNIYQVYLEK